MKNVIVLDVLTVALCVCVYVGFKLFFELPA